MLRFVLTRKPSEGSPLVVEPRFIDPFAVVAVVAGPATLVLLQGGHQVPVDATPEIVREKVVLARQEPVGYKLDTFSTGNPSLDAAVAAAESGRNPVLDALANRARQRDQNGESPDEQEGDVEMMEMHEGPAEPWPEHG